jgi:Domain of unknown function (DUF4124)
MRVPITCTLALVLASAAPCATAQLFKWVDEDGVVNYGDSPPSGVRVLPVTHGTVSAVSGAPSQQVEEVRARDQRRAQRVRRDADAATTAPAVLTTASTDDIPYGDGYAPAYGYPARNVVRPLEPRPRPEQPIANPTLPNLPAIPDMPLRPRR